MSFSFPGPPRPRRFGLRRASRYPATSYGQQHAGRNASVDAGTSLGRRGVVGGLVLVAFGSTVDLVRVLTRGSSGRAVGDPAGLTPRVVNLLTGNLRADHTTPRPTASVAPSPHPSHSHAPAHHHSHAPARHGTGHHPPHHHETKQERAQARRAREHVTLPPAQLHVRSHPAYRLDQLIPHPPAQALALTIDDGPDPEYTPDVLRLLDKYQTQASFCVIGVHADAYPKLVRDIARAGHILVNHSYTHVLPFNRLPEKRIVTEITKTQRAIERAAGVTPQLFRSPGGDWSRFIFRALAAYGLEPLDWDVDPRDWTRPGTRKITRRMLRARPGEIVLCHDGGGDRIQTVRALRKVLPRWQHKGLLTVPLQITPHYLSNDGSSTSS
ncbi:MAG TPA: polysaccharide deacetylase family protein [Mycobacteriales bacterium]|nr:polysaccharide deacetylase family protein [Mycobacteriales bacterium]